MKIAFYISSLSGGGAEKVLTTIANALANKENEIHVISLEKRPQFYSLNKEIYLHKIDVNKKGKISSQIKDYIFVKKCFETIKADINISFLSRCNFLLLVAGMFSKSKIIVCDRNNPIQEHSRLTFYFSNLLYMRADAIGVQTKQIKSFYNNCLQEKIFVLENPIDNIALHKQIENKNIVKENTIISIGRLEPQKDFETLISSFSRLMKDYPNWKLKIFGVGEKQCFLQDYINKYNASDKIMLCGLTKEPFFELSKSKIFVLSTHYEGFPNVLCEAMEAGLTCIASDCVSGPRELINNGVNGWLFEIGNDNQLEKILRKCIESYDENLGREAKKSVKRLYLDSNILRWEKIIQYVYLGKNSNRDDTIL